MSAVRERTRDSGKRGMIVDAAERLFMRHGIRKVTVEDICRTAGVSKMTFYKYFPNKIELLKRILNAWADDIYEKLEEMKRNGAPFADQMRAAVEYKMELIARLNPDLIADMLTSSPDMEQFIGEYRVRTMKRFMEFVAEAQERGEMRSVRPEFLIAVIARLSEIARDERLRRLYPDDLSFYRELNDLFMFGIMPSGEERSS